jgi:glycosyltransferase involved in cell wall biosynthesis
VKVLHVITGLNDGGAEAVLYRLCSTDEPGRHVVVSMMDEGKYGALLKSAGVELHCLYSERGRISYKSIRKLWCIIRDTQPTIVQTWMYHANLIGGLVAFFSGVKRIIWGIRHVHLTKADSKFSTRMIDRISALLSYWVPEQIIAISQKVSEVHINKGYAKKFTLVYNGCDTTKFYPMMSVKPILIEELGISPHIPIVGCVARWTPEKDHSTFLKAVTIANRKHPLQVLLVGTGCIWENDILRELVRNTGAEGIVTLVGPRNDIPEIMNLLDIHVLPSKNEAFGNVLIEAMASGTPCVSTRVGDAEHIIGDTGWIVDTGDHEAMAQRILDALEERKIPETWQRRSGKSRTRIENNFSIVKMLADYRSVWTHNAQKN